jgi:hypothetical protein
LCACEAGSRRLDFLEFVSFVRMYRADLPDILCRKLAADALHVFIGSALPKPSNLEEPAPAVTRAALRALSIEGPLIGVGHTKGPGMDGSGNWGILIVLAAELIEDALRH